jgi:hypothetical protein
MDRGVEGVMEDDREDRYVRKMGVRGRESRGEYMESLKC